MSDLEKMAATLEATGKYRVLRKLESFSPTPIPPGTETRVGMFVDVETTGLDSARDEVIELAMIPFVYGMDGRIFAVKDPFHGYQEPKKPIPPEITALTGITNEMVAGKKIDPIAVASFLNEAALIVAHNAGFDRKFLERMSPAFVTKPWACSMSQVEWGAEGYEGAKLSYLAMEAGVFYDKHRATNDCLASIHLLASALPKSKVFAMAQLLERARRPSWRIWAENAPFDQKDILKARGYRWNGDSNPSPRAWYTDVDDSAKDAELEYLRKEIYQRPAEPLVKKITAFERFSVRC